MIGNVGSLVVAKGIEIISVFSEEVSALHIAEDSYVLNFFREHNLLSLFLDALLK